MKGPMQASIYDATLKCILTYIGLKYDRRVCKAFDYTDKKKGTALLSKLTAPTITKVVQVDAINKDGKYKVMGETRFFLVKEGKVSVLY